MAWPIFRGSTAGHDIRPPAWLRTPSLGRRCLLAVDRGYVFLPPSSSAPKCHIAVIVPAQRRQFAKLPSAASRMAPKHHRRGTDDGEPDFRPIRGAFAQLPGSSHSSVVRFGICLHIEEGRLEIRACHLVLETIPCPDCHPGESYFCRSFVPNLGESARQSRQLSSKHSQFRDGCRWLHESASVTTQPS